MFRKQWFYVYHTDHLLCSLFWLQFNHKTMNNCQILKLDNRHLFPILIYIHVLPQRISIRGLYHFIIVLFDTNNESLYFPTLFQAKFLDFKIQNMVGSCDVKFPIRLEGLVLTHQQFSRYEHNYIKLLCNWNITHILCLLESVMEIFLLEEILVFGILGVYEKSIQSDRIVQICNYEGHI